MQNFKPLASLYSWAGQFASYLVANPEVRFSHDGAHMSLWRLLSQHGEVSVMFWRDFFSNPLLVRVTILFSVVAWKKEMRLKKKVFMCRFNNRESVDKLNILRNFKNATFFDDCFLYWDGLMLSPFQYCNKNGRRFVEPKLFEKLFLFRKTKVDRSGFVKNHRAQSSY